MSDHRFRGVVAREDWFVRARVRFRAEYRCTSVEPLALRIFKPGEELEMAQWGRAGEDAGAVLWWTSDDVYAALMVPGGQVEIVEVVEGQLPQADG